MLRFEIEGNPIPQPRARHVKVGKLSIAYNPKKKEMDLIRRRLTTQKLQHMYEGKDKELTETAQGCTFFVRLTFYIQIPKSLSQKSKNMLSDTMHNKKPDLDNLIKWIMDCGNGILWKDDSKMSQIEAIKIWSFTPRTIIEFGIYE